MKETRKQKRERKERFMSEVLPKLKKYFPVKEIQNGIQIDIDGQKYDYYPGGQRRRKCTNRYSSDLWETITVEQFYSDCMRSILTNENDEWLDPFDFFEDDEEDEITCGWI